MNTFVVPSCRSPSKSLEMSSNSASMPIITNVESINLSKGKQSQRIHRTYLVNYGPIAIRKRQTIAPTLATGRRSKDALLKDEDVIKREIRRQKNRESARNLRKLRDSIEQDLETQINQLETEQKELLDYVNHLRLYKEYLEHRYQQTDSMHNLIFRITATILAELKRNQQAQCLDIGIKEEPHTPSPY